MFGNVARQELTVKLKRTPLTRRELLALFLQIVWRILTGPLD